MRDRLTSVEQRLAKLWSELLEIDVTDNNADFFSLGGHSLQAVRILAVMGQETGVHLAYLDFLETPTISGIARQLESRRASL